MKYDADPASIVCLSGELLCSCTDDVAVIKDSLPEHIRLTLDEPGCLSFKVWQTDDALVWRVEESFISSLAFSHHLQRTRASAWWAATEAIPRNYRITGLETSE
ncbi:putative quinol monooxygenase [Falsihalocynthiibacter arcticus]|uniref:Antibiotic biosynthesis monooxygenase n=1 Tax=Falsihalocynthiibacter arcticus TaxID=1579316 RepID=A0A126V2C4_9RHOB|nr:antibiotic biosynthesis monooxygenase [Falsihalocynthiibacter arcticus]AML52481.1 antibiotic biosynthesis monooxygenase [Falsihalocynthiibacter arcticus]